MAFHERRALGDLAPHVDAFWTSSQSRAGGSVVLPDGCVEVVAVLEGGLRLAPGSSPAAPGAIAVFGLATRPRGILYEGRTLVAGVRLTPAGAMRLVGPALGELADGVAQADEVAKGLASRLRAALEGVAADGRLEHLHHGLRGAIGEAMPGDRRIDVAAALLRAGAMDVSAVAREVGVSTRHLDRSFGRLLGVPPKLLARVARFQRALALGMSGRRGDWAAVAARCGYSDQSHLCREFVGLSGQTPERMRTSMAARDDV